MDDVSHRLGWSRLRKQSQPVWLHQLFQAAGAQLLLKVPSSVEEWVGFTEQLLHAHSHFPVTLSLN